MVTTGMVFNKPMTSRGQMLSPNLAPDLKFLTAVQGHFKILIVLNSIQPEFDLKWISFLSDFICLEFKFAQTRWVQ